MSLTSHDQVFLSVGSVEVLEMQFKYVTKVGHRQVIMYLACYKSRLLALRRPSLPDQSCCRDSFEVGSEICVPGFPEVASTAYLVYLPIHVNHGISTPLVMTTQTNAC